MHKETTRNNDEGNQQDEAVTVRREFIGWLEQLEGIYMHYYEKQRCAARKLTKGSPGRHWQRYDHDKSP